MATLLPIAVSYYSILLLLCYCYDDGGGGDADDADDADVKCFSKASSGWLLCQCHMRV